MTAYRVYCLSVLFPVLALCQQSPAEEPLQPGTLKTRDSDSPQVESKRIFGIIPNFRTSPSLRDYEPLRPAEKFKIAAQDSFDRGTVALAALFAGQAQLTDATPSFGQGVAGYARYLGTSYADFVIGDYRTEAIYPAYTRTRAIFGAAGEPVAARLVAGNLAGLIDLTGKASCPRHLGRRRR